MKKTNILVTGCAGFIGFHTCFQLSKYKKYKVIGIDNLNKIYDQNLKKERLKILKQNKNYEFVKVDISNFNSLSKIFARYKFKYVINLAAQAGVRDSIENSKPYIYSNILGFYNILELSKLNKVKHVIYASSSSVYGSSKIYPYQEEMKTDEPQSLYAATKKTNEILAYSYSNIHKLPTTGLRFFTVYGTFGRPDMAPFKFTQNIIKNKKIELYNYGNHFRDFTYIDDVVLVTIKLITQIPKQKVPYELYNIGGGKTYSLKYFLQTMENIIGKKATTKLLPMQIGDVHKTNADISKIKKKIKIKNFTPLNKGLGYLINWYKSYYKFK